MLSLVCQCNCRWDAGVGRAKHLAGDGADAGTTTDRGNAITRPTRKTLETVVSAIATDNGTDRHELVHHRGDARETFADFNAGDIRGYRIEFTADFARGIDLDIPHILMRGATPQENVDDSFARRTMSCQRFGSQDVRERQSSCGSESETTDFQESTAADAVTVTSGLS